MTDLWKPGEVTSDLRFLGTPLKRRLAVFCIQAGVFQWIFNRKLKITGVPPDAMFVRAAYDETTERFFLWYEHPSFEEAYEGVMPMPHALTVTTYLEDERESNP